MPKYIVNKTTNVFDILDNLSKGYMDYNHHDIEIDKEFISNNGRGTYYFLMRKMGTELWTEEDYWNDDFVQNSFDYFIEKGDAICYKIIVTRFDGNKPYGRFKKVKSF